MASGQWAVVLRHVGRMFHGGTVAGMSEGQLLERFVARRDEVAFEAIIARHGPMVLGVCRGLLDDPRDVEDAFQATFLVLVRKAAGLRDRDLLAPWLHGVARRVSLRARSEAARRRGRERPAVEASSEPVATLDAELRELQGIVRAEVDRLAENERAAVVLCYLEGLTHEEAADRLGWPVGTVKGRLGRARERLRARLSRRGVALPSGEVESVVGAPAVVPFPLMSSTILAASRLATGQQLTAGIVSAPAVALMEGVLRAMFLTKMKLGAVAIAATCAFAAPAVLAWQGGPGPGTAPKTKRDIPTTVDVPEATPGETAPDQKPAAAVPAGGAPSPWANQVRIAEEALKTLDTLAARAVPAKPSEYQLWSRRLAEAKLAAGGGRADKVAAVQKHVEALKKNLDRLETLAQAGQVTPIQLLDARFTYEDGLRWLAEGQAETARAPMGMPGAMGGVGRVGPNRLGGMFSGGGGMGGGMMGRGLGGVKPPYKPTPADEDRNKVILAKLEKPVPMHFSNETSLESLIKYIKEATKGPGEKTIPIYVDPQGLEDSDKTMQSTINLDLEDVALKVTLRLALRQLNLHYVVKEGVLVIDHISEEANNPPDFEKPEVTRPSGPRGIQ